MRLENKDFGKLMKQISNSKTFIPLDIKQVKNIFRDSFNHKECVYVLDFSKNEITHQNGFQNLLGYKKNQISMDFLLNKIHHDDSELVNRIKIATIVFCLKNPVKNRNYLLSLSYRLKKSDDTYIDVLSKSSVYDTDENGKLLSILIRLTDITFMNKPAIVYWEFDTDKLDKKAFKKEIYKEYQNFFTDRELQIIVKIVNGFTNKLIGEKLNISEHTVATHRKTILKKSKCHNINELILFCTKNGIV